MKRTIDWLYGMRAPISNFGHFESLVSGTTFAYLSILENFHADYRSHRIDTIKGKLDLHGAMIRDHGTA